jgi:hypothetical protein
MFFWSAPEMACGSLIEEWANEPKEASRLSYKATTGIYRNTHA